MKNMQTLLKTDNWTLPVGQKQTEKASSADARWFRRSPHRTHRLRRASNSEWPKTCGRWVVVHQIAPGSRIRKPIHLPPGFEHRCPLPTGNSRSVRHGDEEDSRCSFSAMRRLNSSVRENIMTL